ncbi:MAG: ATPase, T2SS/T4P/T4SS family [Lentimonas sp.]
MILVGEIRDLETAKIATEAALTGRLVSSTLHTNNAIQAVVRLVEIGIGHYMVAPSLLAVLG